jgi:hypothetical protein
VRLHGIAAVASLALVVSCGSDGPNEPSGTTGTFSFSFAGTMISGSYSASGSLPANNSTAQPWAVGVRETGENLIGVVAVSPRTGATGRYDMAILAIDRTTAGSASIDVDCDPEGTVACSGMVLFYNLSDTGGAGDVLCGLEAGTITLASVTNSRVTGSFSGTGICINQDDAEEGTNGTFNVPLVSDAAMSIRSR